MFMQTEYPYKKGLNCLILSESTLSINDIITPSAQHALVCRSTVPYALNRRCESFTRRWEILAQRQRTLDTKSVCSTCANSELHFIQSYEWEYIQIEIDMYALPLYGVIVDFGQYSLNIQFRGFHLSRLDSFIWYKSIVVCVIHLRLQEPFLPGNQSLWRVSSACEL